MRILRGPWGERLAFLLAAALLFLGVFAWQPAIYGNDGAAIQRYVQRGPELGRPGTGPGGGGPGP